MAGYKTYWLSNQPILGEHENIVSAMAYLCDTLISTNQTNLNSNQEYYDGLIIDQFQNIISQSTSNPKFIFVHLMGSHIDYIKRYPSEIAKYSEEDKTDILIQDFHGEYEIKKINQYDNTTIYNDSLVYSLIELLKNKDENSEMLYFSDHGDEVADKKRFIGHNEGNPTINMFKVPFIYWSNTKKRDKYKNYLNRPYQTDDLIHSIVDLLDIEFNGFDSTESIFNSHYQPYPRLHKIDDQIYNIDSTLR